MNIMNAHRASNFLYQRYYDVSYDNIYLRKESYPLVIATSGQPCISKIRQSEFRRSRCVYQYIKMTAVGNL